MRGDWDQLVSVPTERETAAALAEVRVRALVHATRSRSRRRMLTGLGAAALLGFGFMVGRRTESMSRLAFGEFARPGGRGNLEYEVVPPADRRTQGQPTSSAESLQRFHITAWTEWEGQRMNEGEGYVEGPPGTSFEMEQWLQASSFTARLRASGQVDSASLNLLVETRRSRGMGSRGRELWEEGRALETVFLRHGQALVFYPFGRERGLPVTAVRIEGPLPPEPADQLPWRPGAPPQWTANLRSPAPDLYRSASRSVRIARLTPGSLMLRGYFMPAELIKVGLADRGPGLMSWVSPTGGTLLKLPGLDVHVRVSLIWPPTPGSDACVRIHPAFDGEARAPGKPPILATGCFPRRSPLAPIEITANSGERFRLELVR